MPSSGADFLLERNGKVVAIEVKQGGRVDPRERKGLTECRDALGKRFARGIALYGGTDVLPLDRDLYAVPLTFLRGHGSGSSSTGP